MKIQVISDTHFVSRSDLSFKEQIINSINPECDVLVHAGDFTVDYSLFQVLETYEKECSKLRVKFLYVLGNHDFYSNTIDNVIKNCQNYSDGLLEVGRTINYKGLTFVGTTFFTDLVSLSDSERNTIIPYLNDFKYIRSSKNSIGNLDVYELKERYDESLKFVLQHSNTDSVLVTHFPLSKQCQHPKYSNSHLNPYFVHNHEELLKGYKNYINGHTHYFIDTEINGCRCVQNPVGYPNEKTGFKPNYFIDLKTT